jgi:hypothetical protein
MVSPEASQNRSEPLARHSIFVASRNATLHVWGTNGLALIGERLPPDTRRDTVETEIADESWLPERYAVDWLNAVWSGPAHQNDARLDEWIRRHVAQGFGRIRRVLLSLVTPALLIERAAELWRHDHTHGELRAHVDGRAARLTLTDHPYLKSPLACRVLAESLRYAASLSRTRGVDGEHTLDPSGLEVQLAWS